MAALRLATFNVNNLFSRFNFRGEVPKGTSLRATITFDLSKPASGRLRTYKGKLVLGKTKEKREAIAERIIAMDAHVLAVQEVEDIDTLRRFNADDLKGHYRFSALVEGNDPRLIDVGILSQYPLGAVVSWQHARHPSDLDEPVFSRDLLQVEILDRARRRTLFTLFNTHLKSKYVPWDDPNPRKTLRKANALRHRQAEIITLLIKSRLGAGRRFAIVGDMNDAPSSTHLSPLIQSDLDLVNGLANARETRPPKKDNPPPPSRLWTHRLPPDDGRPAKYELIDHIWLSQPLAARLDSAGIGRRKNLTGDGSDHDPAWVDLDL